MRFVGLLSMLASGLAGVAVAIRLLGIARRSRGGPERLIAVAFLAIFGVAIPLAGVSRTPALAATPFGIALFFVGMAAVAVGVSAFWVFSWRVFHPGARWARGLAWAGALGTWAAALNLAAATRSAPELGSSAIHHAAYGLLLGCGGAFLWAGVDSLAEWGRARRRVKLGLSDPLVANRMGWWGFSGIVAVATVSVVALALGGNRAVFMIPWVQAAMTAENLLIGTAWWLAFLPPERYRAWVRGRAARAQSR